MQLKSDRRTIAVALQATTRNEFPDLRSQETSDITSRVLLRDAQTPRQVSNQRDRRPKQLNLLKVKGTNARLKK